MAAAGRFRIRVNGSQLILEVFQDSASSYCQNQIYLSVDDLPDLKHVTKRAIVEVMKSQPDKDWLLK